MTRQPKAKKAQMSGMQDHQKPIMQPEKPWKAMPSLGAMPMAGPGQGRVFSASEAFKGLDIEKYADPQIANQNEFAGYGGFIDTGLTQIPQKMFPQAAEQEPTTKGGAVGGFPENADIGSGYGGILNVSGSKRFDASGGEKAPTSPKGGKKPGGK